MKAKDIKDVPRIQPNKEGNIVFLAKLPEFIEGKEGNSYKVSFIEKETKHEASFTIFDPFVTKEGLKDSLVQAGYNKLFRLLRAYIPESKWDAFSEIDLTGLKEALQVFASQFVDPNWANLEATVILGFRDWDGYYSLPSFEPFISTVNAPRDLEYPSKDLHTHQNFTPRKPADTTDNSTKPDKESEEEL